jgi:hypothetical protein
LAFAFLLPSSKFFLFLSFSFSQNVFFFNLRICHKANSLHFQTLEEEEEEEDEDEEEKPSPSPSPLELFLPLRFWFFRPRKLSKLHLLSLCSGLFSRLPRSSFLLFCGEKKRKMRVHCYFRAAC